MKTVAWDENTSYADLLREAQQQDVVILRDGHAVAMMTPFDDDDLQWYAREHDPDFLASLVRAREQVAHQRTTTHQELKRELGID